MAAAWGAVLRDCPSVKSRNFSELLRFSIVGLINTIVGFIVILWLQFGLGWDHRWSNLVGYGAGAILSYLLHRSVTFRSRRLHTAAIPAFLIAMLISYAINFAVLEFCTRFLLMHGALAQAMAVAAYSTVFFWISRKYVFRT